MPKYELLVNNDLLTADMTNTTLETFVNKCINGNYIFGDTIDTFTVISDKREDLKNLLSNLYIGVDYNTSYEYEDHNYSYNGLKIYLDQDIFDDYFLLTKPDKEEVYLYDSFVFSVCHKDGTPLTRTELLSYFQ